MHSPVGHVPVNNQFNYNLQHMRTRILLFVCFMFFASFYSGCKKPDDGVYVDPITLYEKVKGTWKLNEILQIDETAKIAGIAPDEISLFSQFDFKNFSIALNVDAGNQPTSYLVSGNVPELFPKEGFWDLNSPFPAANGSGPTINLYSNSGKTTLIGQLYIVSMPGAQPEMEFKLTRKAAGVPFVSYQYKLSSTNP